MLRSPIPSNHFHFWADIGVVFCGRGGGVVGAWGSIYGASPKPTTIFGTNYSYFPFLRNYSYFFIFCNYIYIPKFSIWFGVELNLVDANLDSVNVNRNSIDAERNSVCEELDSIVAKRNSVYASRIWLTWSWICPTQYTRLFYLVIALLTRWPASIFWQSQTLSLSSLLSRSVCYRSILYTEKQVE